MVLVFGAMKCYFFPRAIGISRKREKKYEKKSKTRKLTNNFYYNLYKTKHKKHRGYVYIRYIYTKRLSLLLNCYPPVFIVFPCRSIKTKQNYIPLAIVVCSFFEFELANLVSLVLVEYICCLALEYRLLFYIHSTVHN